MRKVTKYFLEGLLFLVPVVATIYVIYLVFRKVDGIYKFPVPGMGLLVTLLLIPLIGFIASNVLTRGAVRVIDRVFSRVPLIKMIYTSVRDLTGAFVGEKRAFDKPVSVALTPGGGVSVLGFVTSGELEKLGLVGKVAVYLPQSYNFAGNLIIVPREQVTPVRADSGEFMTFIVSGGISA
jgi:uncharacterized membrane protein